MPVHEYFTRWFQGIEDARARGRTGAEKDALVEAFTREYQGLDQEWDTTGISVEDIAITGPHGPIPLRAYRPEGPATGAMLWAHGGGFLAGDLDMPEGHVVCVELARRAGAFVASVDYRLAQGGVRYPVPIDDVHAAWNWLSGQEAADGRRIGLGGASAGAALAMATALRTRDSGERRADALLLAYPLAHFPSPAIDPALSDAMAGLPMRLGAEDIEAVVRNYVGRIGDLPVDALPGAARLHGLPPTRIVVSEYDDLRPSAELLERQLREAGVTAASYLARGMTHGHLNHLPKLPAMEESIAFLAEGLRG